MADQCSEGGCENEVFARGLCSKHYQRKRRTGFTKSAPLGRPREYDPEVAKKHGGAPKMTVRFKPDLMEWVKDRGGATWVRHAVGELRRLSEDPEFTDWWDDLSLPED